MNQTIIAKYLSTKHLLVLLAMLCLSVPSFAQGERVTGTVTESSGAPLPGVSVLVKNTAIQSVTTLEGTFELSGVKPTDVLVFQFIGMKTEEITVGNQNIFSVIMEDDFMKLDEIVVVGYGVQKKSDVTGSLTSVKAESIMATEPVSINQALQGKVPGMMVVSASTPGSSATVRIRGNRSFSASNEPLYVMDGIPMVAGMDDINPDDVESIEVLKDASATAIYGARGANGVVLITTKKGNADSKVTVSYNGNVGIGVIDREIELFNGAEYAEFVREAYRNSPSVSERYLSDTPSWEEDQKLTIFNRDPYVLESLKMAYDANGNYDPSKIRSYNWQDLGLNSAAIQTQHSVSVTGGSKSTKVFLSGSYNKNQGIMVNNSNERYTMRFNIDQTIGKYITVGAQSTYSFNVLNPGQGIYAAAKVASPLANPYDENGEIIVHPGNDPLAYSPLLDLNNKESLTKNNRISTNVYAQIQFLDGFIFKSSFGLNNNNTVAGTFQGSLTSNRKEAGAYATNSTTAVRMWTMENLLTYNKNIKDHSITVTLLQSAQKSVSEANSIAGTGLPYETQLWYDIGSASTITASSSYTQWNLLSYMGRVNYGYKSKYLLTVSARYDGSSRLAPGNKWVLFPSAAFAWRINEESFLKGNKILSNLKLRLGWGRTGNSSVSPYSTLGGLSISRYAWDNTLAVGYYPSAMSNTSLTWETTEQSNIGIDYGFFKGRISGSVDWYQQNTFDLLMSRQLPRTSGFSSITDNIGKTRNSGIEVSLSTVNIASTNWKWSTDFTFSYNKEQIVELYNGKVDDVGNEWFIGYPVNTFYDYVFDGVWGTDDPEMSQFNANGHSFTPGDIKVKDLDGDYKITDKDRKILGSTYPKYNLGFSSTLNYKNFDLYVQAYGVLGSTIFYNRSIDYDGRYNTIKMDYWTPSHQDTRYLQPRQSVSDFAYEDISYYYDGDFFRINDITLGYTFDKSMTRKMKIEKLRLYLKANRPFLFTNDFPGIDPESAVGSSSFSISSDSPSLRTFMFGVNLTF